MIIKTPKGNIELDAFKGNYKFNPVKIISENPFVTRYAVAGFDIGVATGSDDDKRLREIVGQEAVIDIKRIKNERY